MRNIIVLLLCILPCIAFAQPSKDFKNGTFGLKFRGEVIEGYKIVRKGKNQTEYFKGGSAEFKITWVSDYAYEMTFIRADIPNHLDGDLTVNITSVSKNEYDAIIDSEEGPSVVTMYRIE
ncbi:hypothetical protein N9Y60_00375 [Crocinitomicaceae bacterium]|nr:hypothetical protein [Crocinitomicaceae bacterium]